MSESLDSSAVALASSAIRPVPVHRPLSASAPLVPKLRGMNGNSLLARRYRAVASALADGLGDQDKLGEPTKILVRQAAALTIQVEALQTKIVAGADVDLEQLTRVSNVLGRTLRQLGFKRQAPKPQSRLDAMP